MAKKYILTVLVWLAVAPAIVHGQAKKTKKQQDIEKTERVRRLVEAQDYVFVAERVHPTTGRTRFLTSPYDLTVSRDTVSAFLPYFGRVYVAPADPTEGGIKFLSRDFAYTLEKAKKNGWEVKIITKDGNKRYELFLNIMENGSADLSVHDVTRQSIRFGGRIEPRSPK
jgi:hypothetical protein